MKNFESYIPKKPEKTKWLKDFIEKADEESCFILGLSKVEEFSLPEQDNSDDPDDDAFPVYKCQIYQCDGAFGNAETFFRKHLISVGHCDNFFKELGFEGHVDQDTRAKYSSKDVSSIISIKDVERYWIQRNRLNQVRFITIFRRKAKQEIESKIGKKDSTVCHIRFSSSPSFAKCGRLIVLL